MISLFPVPLQTYNPRVTGKGKRKIKGLLNASAQAGVHAVQALFNIHRGEAARLAPPTLLQGRLGNMGE